MKSQMKEWKLWANLIRLAQIGMNGFEEVEWQGEEDEQWDVWIRMRID